MSSLIMKTTVLAAASGLGLLLQTTSGVAAAAASSPSTAVASAQTAIGSLLRQEAARLDARFLDGIDDRESWEAVRPALRQQYLEMLGLWPLPERTPLAAQTTGVIDREEGFRVENVHFQSRPRLYVTGNLYLPRSAAPGAKLPAVLYVCGHSGRGRDGNKTAFQHHGMWFATHGYACLVIDTLQLGEIAGIHHGTYRYDRWWWQARGYSPAAVECWNGIRALDYLQSRPEVDPERLAVTGISGGGAATFWIAAADERVKVAVPVSGMSDLQDYVGERVVNGHCDCMFLVNTFAWPWTHIAALVAPRPLLFANSGHDSIFPMDGNDRIRAQLERLYSLYTNRTDRLFDIGVVPGDHEDKPELRLMAYRWIDWHLKGTNAAVTEPPLPLFSGTQLRAFPDALPADELNTTIDERFVPRATNTVPLTVEAFETWRRDRIAALRRLVFAALPDEITGQPISVLGAEPRTGSLVTEPGIVVAWKWYPPAPASAEATRWMVVLGEAESIEAKPAWLGHLPTGAGVLVVAPRNTGPGRWEDPAPFYIRRALALLGRTVDGDRLRDVRALLGSVLASTVPASGPAWGIAGRGEAGVIGAYAALFEPRIERILLVDPPASHRSGPIFLNVLRVLDIPDALGLLAPRPLAIHTAETTTFERTAALYRLTGGRFEFLPVK